MIPWAKSTKIGNDEFLKISFVKLIKLLTKANGDFIYGWFTSKWQPIADFKSDRPAYFEE